MPIALFSSLIKSMEEKRKLGSLETDDMQTPIDRKSSRRLLKGAATMLPPETLNSRFLGTQPDINSHTWLNGELDDRERNYGNLKRKSHEDTVSGSKRQAFSSDDDADSDHHAFADDSAISLRRSAWGTPRGRRTIQDKISEQLQRAAEFERELRTVGVPTSIHNTLPSPSLPHLKKSGRKQTVPMSVIRKSPPVRTVEVDEESAPVDDPQDVIASLDFTKHIQRNVMFVPSVIFRLDGMHTSDQLYIPHSLNNFVLPPASRNLDDGPDLSSTDPSKPLREERLSTKLKRIKAKAGDIGEESPRGFLSQKIETLKRRESHLQQQYEDALNAPITRTGISSARLLQQHQNTSAASIRSAQGQLLYHMYRPRGNILPR